MKTLDTTLLEAVQAGLKKQAFVPMPGGQAEPVAGASAMTAGMQAPMGAPQGGGMPPGGGGMPPGGGGMPPGGGGMPPGGDPSMGGGMPPELMQMLSDPQIQQMLNEAGIMIQPDGSAVDGETGQPIPPDILMQVLQEMMGGMEGAGGGAPQEGGMPPEGGGEMPAPEEDPTIALLTEIRDLLKNQKPSGGESKPSGGESKPEGDGGGEASDMGQLVEELRRQNDMMQQMIGGGA